MLRSSSSFVSRAVRTPPPFASSRMVHIERRLEELGLELPSVNPPKGYYKLSTISGDHLYTAGHLPQPKDGDLITGRLGTSPRILSFSSKTLTQVGEQAPTSTSRKDITRPA